MRGTPGVHDLIFSAVGNSSTTSHADGVVVLPPSQTREARKQVKGAPASQATSLLGGLPYAHDAALLEPRPTFAS